jgi:hypothetical protein
VLLARRTQRGIGATIRPPGLIAWREFNRADLLEQIHYAP